MNANELADVIDSVGEDWAATLIGNFRLKEAATMLRQQQAEIEALKLSLSGNSAQILSKNEETLPNGKPVAWRRIEENGWYVYYETECWDDLIPLYTHPAKTLTDEDLIEDLTHFVEKLHRRWGDDLWIDATDLMAIEKAIELLRKAQEK